MKGVPGIAWDSYSWDNKKLGVVTLHLTLESQADNCCVEENCKCKQLLPFNFIHKCSGKEYYSAICFKKNLLETVEELKRKTCTNFGENSTLTIFLELNGKIVIQERDC